MDAYFALAVGFLVGTVFGVVIRRDPLPSSRELQQMIDRSRQRDHELQTILEALRQDYRLRHYQRSVN